MCIVYYLKCLRIIEKKAIFFLFYFFSHRLFFLVSNIVDLHFNQIGTKSIWPSWVPGLSSFLLFVESITATDASPNSLGSVPYNTDPGQSSYSSVFTAISCYCSCSPCAVRSGLCPFHFWAQASLPMSVISVVHLILVFADCLSKKCPTSLYPFFYANFHFVFPSACQGPSLGTLCNITH